MATPCSGVRAAGISSDHTCPSVHSTVSVSRVSPQLSCAAAAISFMLLSTIQGSVFLAAASASGGWHRAHDYRAHLITGSRCTVGKWGGLDRHLIQAHYEWFRSTFKCFLVVCWTKRHQEACVPPSYTRGRPLECLKLLPKLPRHFSVDVCLGSHSAVIIW